MLRQHFVFALVLLAGLAAGESRADVLTDFEGEWQGLFADQDGAPIPGLPPASVAISKTDDGFLADWNSKDGRSHSASFSKPEGFDFYVSEEDHGVLSMFTGDDPPNPLDGDPLVWARIGENELILYVLEIAATGAYQLHMNTYTGSGNTLDLSASVWLHGEPGSKAKSQLERAKDEG